ncbi:unnamed protein product [Penicillium nalgiovense]|nr:unnamed protein product [Penicillium nalgiovense]
MCRGLLVPASEHYKRAFFFAVESSPVLTTVFAADCLRPLLHDNAILQDTVSLLGGYYASQNPQLLSVLQTDKTSLFPSLQSLRSIVAAESQPTANIGYCPPVILICALLLSFVELLVDPSGLLWDSWVRQLYAFDRRYREISNSVSPLGRSMSRLARIMNALRAEGLPYPGRGYIGTMPGHASLIAWLKTTRCGLRWVIEWKTLISLPRLQQSVDETHTAGSNFSGINITCVASQFWRHMVACALWNSRQELGTFGSAMLTLYQSATIEISHLFSDPCWLSLECELPVMPLQLSYEQARSASNNAESSLQHLHLEAIIYAPVLYAIGMEMACKSDRCRNLKFISDVERKGVSVTNQVLLAIKKDWH